MAIKRLGNVLLRARIFGHRECHAIREQRVDASDLLPVCQLRRIAQDLGNVGFVIALQIKHTVVSSASDQPVQNLPRVWAAIDIVPQEDLDGPPDRIGFEVRIDARQKFNQKIGPPVHVSDGIYGACHQVFAALRFGSEKSAHSSILTMASIVETPAAPPTMAKKVTQVQIYRVEAGLRLSWL